MTKCDKCQQRQATVHMTDISGSEIQSETHLCSQCAETEGLQYNVEIDLSDLIPDDIDIEEVKDLQKREEELSSTECPNCGITFEEFRNTRRLGCPEDYELFALALDPLLEKIHGKLEHRGKVPSGVSEEVKIDHEIQQLERELQSLIDEEEFEEAAEIRDEIEQLEAQKKDMMDEEGDEKQQESSGEQSSGEDASENEEESVEKAETESEQKSEEDA